MTEEMQSLAPLQHNSENRPTQVRTGFHVQFVIPAFSKGRVDRAGDILRDPKSPHTFIEVEDAFDALSNWRASHAYPLQVVKMLLKGRSKRIDRSAIVSQRLKRLPSVLRKLTRPQTEGMKLSRMQDIGGCRAIVSNMAQVNELVAIFEAGFKKNPHRHSLAKPKKDYIAEPKTDGYRSVHMVVRYKSSTKEHEVYDGILTEVQIRTKTQHAWATAVETVDTLTKQSLKFDVEQNASDPRWKRFFSLMSSAIALRERTALVPGTPTTRRDIAKELRRISEQLQVEHLLRGLSDAIHVDSSQPKLKGATLAYLIILNVSAKQVMLKPFTRETISKIADEYLSWERDSDEGTQVVQVSVEDMNSLRTAYPNYYLDTHVFLDFLKHVTTKW